ncbi:glycosyltransferase [Meridianimarinicoccus sp. MJW13]|uniref:glycosyltransferase n=1 Tax=Meridianimarinicoccus sp. MJW13 TaxID=2720031 RepID=UPI001868B1ED|nr:glycosyltransferase [Fluviibacterium sp. MJW13]
MTTATGTPATAPCGFVFGASGDRFAKVADRAARSLRAASPGIPIDIYTDSPVDESAYDMVHALGKSWFRPKFEALLRSRFERTVYLDVDIVVVGDISDIFDVLERFDVALAHVQNRNQKFARKTWRKPIPNAFPQFNGGLLGIRRSPEVTEMLMECIAALEAGAPKDQPVLRELIYDSSLRVATLPPEYNSRDRALWQHGSSRLTAPRVLHASRFMRFKNGKPITPEQLYGRAFMRHVKNLLAEDRTLNPDATGYVPRPYDLGGRLGNLFRIRRG